MIDWSIAQNALAQPDPGQRFQMGFQMAQDRQRQQREDEFRTQQREAQATRQQQEDMTAQLERHRENIIKGARIVREINPQDEAGWQQARALAAQMGIPMDEVPATFDPAYVQNLVKVADTFAPHTSGGQATNIQKEVDYYRSIGRPELADQLLSRHAEGPPIVASNGDGTFTMVPPAAIRQPSAASSGGTDEASLRAQAEEAIQAGADPAAVNARLQQMLGGGAGPGPRTFP